MSAVGTVVVGYGYWGVNLARNVGAAGKLDLVGVVDADADRREAAVANVAGIKTWASLGAALDDEQVEAVILASPAGLHEEMALEVLGAGRHVLVEKPLATTAEGAARIVAAAGETGLTAMVGHTFLYSVPVRMLRDLIVGGDLGALQYLYSQRLSLGRVRRDCNALWNFAPHDISIMLYLLDERPVEVSARGFCFIEEPIDDVCFGSLEFESGIGANLHVSWMDPRKTRLMTVVGDEQMAIYNDVSVDQKLWVVDSGVARADGIGTYESVGEFQWQTRAGDIHIPRIALVEPLLTEVEAFGEACRTGEAPLTDARHGEEVVRILVALDESSRARGQPVRIDW